MPASWRSERTSVSYAATLARTFAIRRPAAVDRSRQSRMETSVIPRITGTDALEPTIRSHWVGGVAFSPNGGIFATSCGDRLIRLWDVNNGGEIAVLPGHTGRVGGLSFSLDGQTLASAGEDRTVR